ncbi:MAG: glycosyltransferase family 4 protein [Mucilaginibacter polytrichastri]|nr:glycosyltransferase family 4 protein [Mucilaginibacter polytrichastri]
MTTFSGGEIVLERLMKNLKGYESYLAVPPGPFADRVIENGTAHVILTPSLQKLNRNSNKFYLLHFVRALLNTALALYKIIKSKQCDAVVGNSFGVAGYTALAAALTRKPGMWIHHHPFVKRGTLEAKAARIFSRRLKKAACVSDAIRNSLIKSGVKTARTVTIHNGLDVHEFDPARVESGFLRTKYQFPEKLRLVGIVGVITSWKGHLGFVESIKYVRDKGGLSDVHFLIIGDILADSKEDKHYKDNLIRFVNDHGLQDAVTFTGRLNNMVGVYRDLDIMVNNSIEPEPFGTTIYEAMAFKNAVVATHVGGSPEIVDHQVNGFLVEPDDVQGLGECLMRILNMDAAERERLGNEAREKVIRALSVDRMEEEYRQTFDEIILGKG